MLCKQLVRYLHLNRPIWASVSKSDLAKLRKKTGYTFANCKKALEVNNNDFILAEKWLKEQAEALGWAKATKLEGRATLQGLIGLTLREDTALMVEVNCETDFVARNKKFISLVELAAQSSLQHALNLNFSHSLSKFLLDSSEVRSIISEGGKTLADEAAVAISSLGENLIFRRAVIFKSDGSAQLAGYTHPSPANPNASTLFGKYGALIAYKAQSQQPEIQQTAKQLCQHIVGMNPTKIGDVGLDKPVENKDEESVMIFQDFLIDPSVTVSQLLSDMGIEILDFVRFECGQAVLKDEVTPLKAYSQG